MKRLSDCRVLLVDDAKVNLDILVEGLRGEYQLSVARDGETALQIAARTPPDLVLLDIVMPGIDGYEVCRRLREMPETAEVPIMFLSSLEDVKNKTKGFEVGGNDYVTKPFDMLEVKARARSLLKAKAYNDAVKEQIASELRVARNIQMSMVPHNFTAVEQAYGVSVAAALEPAREVGGDLYGVCAAGPERLVTFLGDVSGKGIPAALFMVRAMSLAQLLAQDIVEPERVLARLNDELAADNPSSTFVTFVCAVYEPKSHRLTLANGGQCRPMLLPANEPPRWAVNQLGTALGFEVGLPFERTELVLKPGDALILYSDGVSEAFNPQDDCYGNERLLADAAGCAGQSASAITANLLQKVREFAGSARQSDDIAILTLKVNRNDRMTLELHATSEEVMRGVEALQRFATARGLHEKDVFALALALEECSSNIVHHSLRRDAKRMLQVVVDCFGDAFVIELRDDGPEFDPTGVAMLDPEPGDETVGGWGLELVRRNVDDISYRREGGTNVLRLTRRLVSATRGE